MDVVSTCPLRVASIVWQPRPGAWTLTVVCKATFALAPGESRLAELQDEPIPHDRHVGDDAQKSLLAATDLVPWKPRADVLLVGSAFAPQGRPARSVVTRLHVGEIDKRIDVRCDRVFWQDGRLLEGQPFTQLPIGYERAAGGPATTNPAGIRFDAAPDAHGSVPIPNLQPTGSEIARRGDTFAPIAYGPIAPAWPGRADRHSRHAGWAPIGWSARPLPTDFDLAYFNSAPPDQQLASIRADERILLENLHREHPLMVTRLPGLEPRAHLTTGGLPGEAIELVADTLSIDADRGLATVVWRGRLALSHAREEGRIVVSMVAAGAGKAASGAAAADPSATVQLAPVELPTMLGGQGTSAPLPFLAGKSPWSFGEPPAAPPPPPASKAPEDTGTMFGVRSPEGALLPFPTKTPAIAPTPLTVAAAVAVEVAAPAPVFFTRDPGPEPDMIGPLARVNMASPEPDPSAPRLAGTVVSLPEATPPVDGYPLERAAAIAASIARRRSETAKILEENDLTAPDWAAHEQRWNEEIIAELKRGKTDLLHAFDRAYVARLEEERGTIRVEEYARLVIAAERGTLSEILAELTLPRGGMIRIERIWLAKLDDDAELGRSVRREIELAREG